MTPCDLETSVPDWLIEHPEILPVLQEFGVDYTCGGKSLEYACQARGLDVDTVLAALNEAIEAHQREDAGTPEQER